MLVKICGLRTVEHALAAATAGADLIGLVFAPSRRRVEVAAGTAIAQALRALPRSPQLVGLFVNEPAATINALADTVGLDCAQLSGDEPPELLAQLRLPVLKAVRLDGSANEAAWLALASRGTVPLRLLVDAHVPGMYGGTGTPADWERAAVLARQAPTLLAGGLNALTLAAAITAVRPLGVDVSSGVETDGVKDTAKIEAFIAAARAA